MLTSEEPCLDIWIFHDIKSLLLEATCTAEICTGRAARGPGLDIKSRSWAGPDV